MKIGVSWFMVLFLLCGCSQASMDVQSVDFESENVLDMLAPLGQAIGESQIVLLGENGHGVGEFSRAKVDLVKWLHQEYGFELVVFESGLFECGYAWQRIDTLTTREALLDCLRYPFQHAELLPLFQYIKEQRGTDHPLKLAGMDPQAQGFDSAPRPGYSFDILNSIDPFLASEVARSDTAIYLASSAGGKGDALYSFAYQNHDSLQALYQWAAYHTEGWQHWTFRLAEGWIDRLAMRGRAESEGSDRPGAYYEVRDEWMAKAVAAHADSIDGARKVLVWLHNEHGAYGSFQAGEHRIRSTGSFLQEWYGDRVYSIGFFMGQGTAADNGRTVHDIVPPDSNGVEHFMAGTGSTASYLILRGNSHPKIREWSETLQPYLRSGLKPISIIPAEEFDALLYIDSVSPPNYDLR